MRLPEGVIIPLSIAAVVVTVFVVSTVFNVMVMESGSTTRPRSTTEPPAPTLAPPPQAPAEKPAGTAERARERMREAMRILSGGEQPRKKADNVPANKKSFLGWLFSGGQSIPSSCRGEYPELVVKSDWQRLPYDCTIDIVVLRGGAIELRGAAGAVRLGPGEIKALHKPESFEPLLIRSLGEESVVTASFRLRK